MTTEDIWRRKSDEELNAAAQRLDDYTEVGRRIIQAEVERRKTPEYRAKQEAAQRHFEKEAAALSRQDEEARPIAWSLYLKVNAVLAVSIVVLILVFASAQQRASALLIFFVVEALLWLYWRALRLGGKDGPDLLWRVLYHVARGRVKKRAGPQEAE